MNHLLSKLFGGAERDRTADPLLAKQVLSQLSYSPNLYAKLAREAGPIGRTAYARKKSRQYNVSSAAKFHPFVYRPTRFDPSIYGGPR